VAGFRRVLPPDEEFTELLARVGVPLVPFGKTWRSWATRPSTAEERVVSVDEFVAEYIAATYDTVAEAAEGCDALVASGMLHFVARSVAEKLAVPHRFAIFSESLLDAQTWHALVGAPINTHQASIDLPPVDDVREFLFTEQPWVAADPALSPREAPADLTVARTAAWILPDERPLPAELVASCTTLHHRCT
jgi:vancomycin aglycone glucosyltransferase